MKNSIKILAAFGILILMSFTASAQTNDWTGKWNTTLAGKNTLGDLSITKSSNGEYIGVFPNGKIAGKMIPSGDLIGTYTRTTNSFDRTGMGKMGEFKFIMSTDKKTFQGFYKVEGKQEWQTDNWNGKRQTGPTLVQQIEIKDIKKRGEVLKDYKLPTWTGTWKTDTFGVFKVLDTGSKHNNSGSIKIEGKFFIKGSGDFIDIIDVVGYHRDNTPKVFEGTFKHGYKTGYLVIKFGTPTDNDFSGYLNYHSIPGKTREIPTIQEKRVYVKGHRTSSSKPNMHTPN